MREQLKFKYGASRYSVLGEDGNVIDAVWIPCVHPKGGPGGTATNRSGDALPTTDPSTRHPNSVSSSTAVGTVLFCCPNAGLYECVSQSNPQASWLGIYQYIYFTSLLTVMTGVSIPFTIVSFLLFTVECL